MKQWNISESAANFLKLTFDSESGFGMKKTV